MNPLVSVVVPTFNGARHVRAALESILAQDYEPFEVRVCDDGSTDDTVSILETFGPPVKVARQPNAGVPAARNRAARDARGELFAFLDQDDLWEPGMLSRQVAALASRPECGFVYADSWIIDDGGRKHGRRGRHLRYAEGRVFSSLLDGNFVPIETLVMRADLFRELDGFRTHLRFLEDYDLCLRAAHGASVAFCPEPLARYRVHGENLTRGNMESILREYAQLLEEVPTSFDHLTDETLAHSKSALDERYAELAWYALRRADLNQADAWLERLSSRPSPGLWRRVRLLRGLLRPLPHRLGRALVTLLPKRRPHGF